MRWRIYYDDGSTFSDVDGEPWESPSLGVQCICQNDSDVGIYILHGQSYFYFEDGLWEQCDIFGLWDYLARRDPHKVVRFGRNMPSKEYRRVFERASNDPDFPRKSGFKRDERQP